MSPTEWRKAHQGWVSGALFLGLMAGIVVRHAVSANLMVQLLVSGATTVAVAVGLPAMAWFFASDGRRAQR